MKMTTIIVSALLIFMQTSVLAGFEIPTFENQVLQFPVVNDPLKIPLHYMDGVPTLSFGLGTPAQPVTAVFDTGSVVTWIMSDKCNTTVCPGVEDSQKFHQSDSSTNKALGYTIDINYIDGTFVRLEPELDKLTLTDGIVFPDHLVGEAYEVRYPKGHSIAANGRLGAGDFGAFMKYMDSAQGKSISSIVHDVEGVVKSILSRAVGDDRTSSGYGTSAAQNFKKRDGVHAPFFFTIGSDPTMYSDKLYDLALMPESENTLSPFWKLPLHGVKLVPGVSNSTADPENPVEKGLALLELVLSDSSYGSIDSSTPYLHFPRRLSQALNKKLGADYDSSLGVYTIPCERKRDEKLLLVFEFEGVDALLPAHQYIIKKHDQCHSAIVDANTKDDDEQIHLGGPFFRSFYLEYHTSMRQISIAESTAKLGLLRESSSDNSYDLVDLADNGLDVLSEI